MLGIWCIFLCVTAKSDSYMMSGVANSVKTLSENFPWPLLNRNTTDDLETTSSSPKWFDSTKLPEITEHLTETLAVNQERVNKYEPGSKSKFVTITKNSFAFENLDCQIKQIFNYSNDGDFGDFDETVTAFNSSEAYFNDIKTFLDSVEHYYVMTKYSSVRERLPSSGRSYTNVYNASYQIPIPNTNKYHEIQITDITPDQFIHILTMVKEYVAKNSKKLSFSRSSSQQSVKRLNIDTNHKKVTRALTDLDSSGDNFEQTPQTPVQYKMTRDSLNNQERAQTNYEHIFTPEWHDKFMKSFSSKSVYGESFGKISPSINSSLPIIMNKNGHHAEIITDYKLNHDIESRTDTSSIQEMPDENKKQTNEGRTRTILTALQNQGAINSAPQTRSKRPILNTPDARRNTKYDSLPREQYSLLPQPVYSTANSNQTLNHYENSSLSQESTNKFVRNPMNNLQQASDQFDSRDWFGFSKFISNVEGSLSDPNSSVPLNSTANDPKTPVSDSLDIVRAANWLIVMHNRLEEEKMFITEQYKKHIKDQLGGESIVFGKEENGRVMKINKKDNILEGIKGLMLEYLETLKLNKEEIHLDPGSASLLESVMNSTNVFELMESSSRYVKKNLKSKLEMKKEAKPTPTDLKGFLCRIVEKQKEKCETIFNRNSEQLYNNKTELFYFQKRVYNKRLMMFTNCMNTRLQKCIRGFGLWLKKGKYHLRKQFKLGRAYERYEMERNLYCLRPIPLSSLGSTPRGMRVKPRMKVQRKNGMKHNKQNLPLNRVRKLKNQNRMQQADRRLKANKKSNLEN